MSSRSKATVQVPDITDADRTYLECIAEDCRLILGPEIELESLEFATNADCVLRLRYRLGSADWTSEVRGETVVAAHNNLRQGLVLDRIRLGVKALYRQTNREDVGKRYLEIQIPIPPTAERGVEVSERFRRYFTNLSAERARLGEYLKAGDHHFFLSGVEPAADGLSLEVEGGEVESQL